MIEIPLFPLKTVLFPGMPISLHIFEERYKAMVETCVAAEQPFGVVLIEEGQEALGPLAKPHAIGCTAQITQIERLPDGRLNIVAVGMERFRLTSLSYEEAYLTGTVEMLPLDVFDTHNLDAAGNQLRPWVERYLAALSEMTDEVEFQSGQLPNDPLALAYLAASVVQIPVLQKQHLLATGQAAELLTDISSIFRREVALLNAMLAQEDLPAQGLFSLN